MHMHISPCTLGGLCFEYGPFYSILQIWIWHSSTQYWNWVLPFFPCPNTVLIFTISSNWKTSWNFHRIPDLGPPPWQCLYNCKGNTHRLYTRIKHLNPTKWQTISQLVQDNVVALCTTPSMCSRTTCCCSLKLLMGWRKLSLTTCQESCTIGLQLWCLDAGQSCRFKHLQGCSD
jgi:hypothetical protein